MSDTSKPMIREAVRWAAENYRCVVKRDGKTGAVRYSWSAAKEEPPSMVAESYMELAATNPTAFFKDIVPRFLGSEEEGEIAEEDVVREKKSVQQIRSILSRFREAK